jgi:orotidine 5'-phosphate decarboxylase subfamily 2
MTDSHDRTLTTKEGGGVATFGARFRAALDERGPLCGGIDPHASLLAAWGLPDDASGLERFALTAVEALAPRLAVVKPQSAFFERFGSRGVAVLERVIANAREAGALVLLDVKRGDIGSTVQAYADAYLDPVSPLRADAITASPYLGFGSLQPLLDTAAKFDGGVFVLAQTSNPEGPQVQQARTDTGRTVAGDILDRIAATNAGESPLGSVGAVVGATVAATGEDFAAVNGPLLAPGIGTQGGTADDLREVFGAALRNVVPSSSREILRAGPSVQALRDAADRTLESVRAVLDPA